MFGIISRVISYLPLYPPAPVYSDAVACILLPLGVCVLTCVCAFRSVAAFLFPIFASYKALKANDQTQLTPWLMYWVVIACVVVVENFLGWFLNLLPLYQEVKAIFLLWLVLPQTQGATYLYMTYIHPYILTHEADIENLIASGHNQLRTTGMMYLRRLWAYLQQLLGVPPQDQTRPPTPPQAAQSQAASYAQLLLQRFSLPPIGPFDPAANFLSSLISTFSAPQTDNARGLGATTTTSSSNMTGSFQLPNLPREEKLSYIEDRKRELVKYIKYLDDAAAQHHNEDLRPPSRPLPGAPRSPVATPTSPYRPDSRRWSGGSIPGGTTAVQPQFADEGFEAVNPEDLPSGSVIASGVKGGTDEVTRRGWFSSWGAGSAPQSPQ